MPSASSPRKPASASRGKKCPPTVSGGVARDGVLSCPALPPAPSTTTSHRCPSLRHRCASVPSHLKPSDLEQVQRGGVTFHHPCLQALQTGLSGRPADDGLCRCRPIAAVAVLCPPDTDPYLPNPIAPVDVMDGHLPPPGALHQPGRRCRRSPAAGRRCRLYKTQYITF